MNRLLRTAVAGALTALVALPALAAGEVNHHRLKPMGSQDAIEITFLQQFSFTLNQKRQASRSSHLARGSEPPQHKRKML